ncbi:MAG: hypothetical protein ABIT07_07620 [Ferruginibacter sp.]
MTSRILPSLLIFLIVGSFYFISCSKTGSAPDSPPPPQTGACSGTAGPLFTNVKSLMTAKCRSCHNNLRQDGGKNWEMDCNIVTDQARIKVRADDGTMPPTGSLSQAEKNIITNWINGGGKFSD